MSRLPYPYYMRTKKNGVLRKPTQKKFTLEFNQDELNTLIRLLEFSQLEIHKQFKKLGQDDYDLKEIFYHYRFNCNQIRNKLKSIRGF